MIKRALLMIACVVGGFAILFAIGLLPKLAHGQEGECADGLCGTPDESGGGGENGGGSVIVANTDLGDTHNYADDYDEDGIEDNFDNCPWHSNPDQNDKDSDGWGDACDVCIATWNPNQFDRDNDKLGDWCDGDLDGDSVPQPDDNCRYINNPGQVDTDGDGIGNACDDDDDGDTILDVDDECPLLHRKDYSRHMTCVNDMDKDYVNDHIDNCVSVFNTYQEDADRDGIGDACDHDIDGNGINDRSEWHPTIFLTNSRQTNSTSTEQNTGCSIAPRPLFNSLNLFRR